MDAQQMISEFLASDHGAQAMQALGSQGVGAADAQQYLSTAAGAAAEHVGQQGTGPMGEHSGKSFFSAFAAGLVHGDGFLKSLVEGGEGVISGRIAESLAARAGVDPSKVAMIAAAATPYVVNFLKQKFA